ncbi:glycosyltransferase family 2 protein [Rosistilla oblonga]|uniref:glycosyltransferase family 2 protein n=1 Tax=Rosistilla oblonga TaxID=2527990 RepID=UPI003A97CA4A
MVSVSIIMPTYNRAAFLPEAFAAIKRQTFRDWELIVVDDGSVDDTKKLFDDCFGSAESRATYVYQDNAGAYAARKLGLLNANGRFVAFYDSDDIWFEDYLNNCIEVLRGYPGVDWVSVRGCHVSGESPIDDLRSREMSAVPESVLALESSWNDDLQIFTDTAFVEQLLLTAHSFGLPLSVIRRSVFDRVELRADLRNGEDRMFLIRAIKSGVRVAQLHRLQYVFRKHRGNSSSASLSMAFAARAKVYESLVRGYLDLKQEVRFSDRELKALHQRVAHDLFWSVGYNIHWMSGDEQGAFSAFAKALRLTPMNTSMQKTRVSCWFKSAVRKMRRPWAVK